MLGSIIGAGVGLGTSLWGGISAGKNRRRQKKAINNAITDNQSWYDANYNADVLQRADAQRQISQLRDMMSNRRKYNNNLSAITGATQEAQLANQEADNKALTDVSRDMYARGQQYKDNVMNAYLNRKDRLNNSMYNLYDQRASSGENLMNTGLNFMSKSLSSGDFFNKNKDKE